MNKRLAQEICDNFLRHMKSGDKWTLDPGNNARHRREYWSVLERYPDWFASVIKRDIRRKFDWRPTVYELDKWFQEVDPVATACSAEEAYAYLVRMRNKFSFDARPHPTIKNVRVSGPPRMTKIMEYCIECMGGWRYFVGGDEKIAVEQKRFKDYYEAFLKSYQRHEQQMEIQHLLPLPGATVALPSPPQDALLLEHKPEETNE